MATKKSDGKRGARDDTNPTTQPPVPFDRRLMEKQFAAVNRLLQEREFGSVDEINAFLDQNLNSGMLPEPVPTTPLERAQDLIYQALEATGKRRLELAHEALAISPDCADAYVLLAEAAPTLQEKQRLYEQGVQAGERALGRKTFKQDVGHFWGLMETRPYMRARQGLAEVLWRLGERESAIAHAKELLRLNPGDNQGIRYLLASWLLVVGSYPALQELLAKYPDEWSAQWAYTSLLLALQRQGPGPQADRALQHALEVNPHVPPYLLGLKPFPKRPPDYYGMGDDNEAVVYLAEAAEAWVAHPQAIAWLADALPRLAPPAAARSLARAGRPTTTHKRRQTPRTKDAKKRK